jgi:membrane-bound ClpP family serine protease
MTYSVADASITGLSLMTLAGVIFLIKDAFKKQHMNIFGHLMIILIVFGLISKSGSYNHRV